MTGQDQNLNNMQTPTLHAGMTASTTPDQHIAAFRGQFVEELAGIDDEVLSRLALLSFSRIVRKDAGPLKDSLVLKGFSIDQDVSNHALKEWERLCEDALTFSREHAPTFGWINKQPILDGTISQIQLDGYGGSGLSGLVPSFNTASPVCWFGNTAGLQSATVGVSGDPLIGNAMDVARMSSLHRVIENVNWSIWHGCKRKTSRIMEGLLFLLENHALTDDKERIRDCAGQGIDRHSVKSFLSENGPFTDIFGSPRLLDHLGIGDWGETITINDQPVQVHRESALGWRPTNEEQKPEGKVESECLVALENRPLPLGKSSIMLRQLWPLDEGKVPMNVMSEQNSHFIACGPQFLSSNYAVIKNIGIASRVATGSLPTGC
jgi:hypothetical protein